MDLYLVFLALACLGGVSLPFLISFRFTLKGSINPESWSAGGGFGPLYIIFLPERRVHLRIFAYTILAFRIPEDDDEVIEGDKREEGTGMPEIPVRAMLRLPISIDSVSVHGRIGFMDAADTGRFYGWMSAVRGALSITRIKIRVAPDFARSGWSIAIMTRFRIRSLIHLIYALTPILRSVKPTYIP